MYYIYLFIFLIIILNLLIYINIKEYYSIELFSSRAITSIGKDGDDIYIYGQEIDLDFSKVNMPNVTQLCSKNKNNPYSENCVDITDKLFPAPGNPGICSNTDCFLCSCLHGEEAPVINTEDNSPAKCNKRGQQCITCNAGYYLQEQSDNTYICVQCPQGTHSHSRNRFINECRKCEPTDETLSELNTLSGDVETGQLYPQGACSFGSHIDTTACNTNRITGYQCRRNNCLCPNGKSSYENRTCPQDGLVACMSCERGYGLAPSPNTPVSVCEVCPSGSYNDTSHATAPCWECPTAVTDVYKVKDGNKTYITHYLKQCGGSYGPKWEQCPTCPFGEYRKGCGVPAGGLHSFRGDNTEEGVRSDGQCVRCDMCDKGNYRSNCGMPEHTVDNNGTLTHPWFDLDAGRHFSNEGSCTGCNICDPGHYAKDCGGFDNINGLTHTHARNANPGNCTKCKNCDATEHSVDCITNSPLDGGCSDNVCTPTATGCIINSTSKCNTNNGKLCDNCEAGYYHTGQSCAICPFGQYKSGRGKQGCSPCTGCQGSNPGRTQCTPATVPTMWRGDASGDVCMGKITNSPARNGHSYGHYSKHTAGDALGKGEKANIKDGDTVKLCLDYWRARSGGGGAADRNAYGTNCGTHTCSDAGGCWIVARTDTITGSYFGGAWKM